jgi:potassium-transporting ATPase KdpC subunit
MIKILKQSLIAFAFFTLLLGVVYPLFITGIAQVIMPAKANGSLILKDGKTVGSGLIGQNFDKPEYFHSRPSAVNYDAANSGASNLGPSSAKLMDQVKARIEQVRKENNLKNEEIPPDMVLSSASGIDPHISQANALIQSKRIARVRNIPDTEVEKLIEENTNSDFIGIWGHPGINVLELNIALDSLKKE